MGNDDVYIPGVPITTWHFGAFFASARTDNPPMNASHWKPWIWRPILRSTSRIWIAISRVGAITSTYNETSLRHHPLLLSLLLQLPEVY